VFFSDLYRFLAKNDGLCVKYFMHSLVKHRTLNNERRRLPCANTFDVRRFQKMVLPAGCTAARLWLHANPVESLRSRDWQREAHVELRGRQVGHRLPSAGSQVRPVFHAANFPRHRRPIQSCIVTLDDGGHCCKQSHRWKTIKGCSPTGRSGQIIYGGAHVIKDAGLMRQCWRAS